MNSRIGSSPSSAFPISVNLTRWTQISRLNWYQFRSERVSWAVGFINIEFSNYVLQLLEKKVASVKIGNTTITPLGKKEETIHVGDDEGSERDEAEGDDSDLGSNLESEDEEEVVDRGQPVKV